MRGEGPFAPPSLYLSLSSFLALSLSSIPSLYLSLSSLLVCLSLLFLLSISLSPLF